MGPIGRESRRATRGKLARPCFRTLGKSTPRCSILGGPIGIQISRFAFKSCWFFDPCHPGWQPFRFIFGSIFGMFWRPLGSILHHFGGFWRPLGVPGGVSEGGMTFHWFLEAKMVAKWSPRGYQNPLKMGSKFYCFLILFLGRFGCQNGDQIRARSGYKCIKKLIRISTRFLSRFWSDFGSILVSFASARTSGFIGRGGELVGSAFFTNVQKW